MPLSTIRDGHDPRDWSRVSDRLTAVALTQLEDSLCPDCGQPKVRAYNPDMNGFYDVVDVQCQGCQALHEHVAGDKDRTPDIKSAVVDTYDEAEHGPLHPPQLPAATPPAGHGAHDHGGPGSQDAPAPDVRPARYDDALGG